MKQLWIITAAFVALALIGTLYYVHDNAAQTAQQIKTLKRDIRAERDMNRILSAEWSSLNDPRRLQKLAREYLNLEELVVSQIQQFQTAQETTLISFPTGDIEGEVGFDTR